ncbi:MAG: hypothetical protein ACI8W7_002987, partial [Gammaproteobacteria bacterium]
LNGHGDQLRLSTRCGTHEADEQHPGRCLPQPKY